MNLGEQWLSSSALMPVLVTGREPPTPNRKKGIGIWDPWGGGEILGFHSHHLSRQAGLVGSSAGPPGPGVPPEGLQNTQGRNLNPREGGAPSRPDRKAERTDLKHH